jgi:hypothetical protein
LQRIGKQHGEYAQFGGNYHLVLRIAKVHLILHCCDLTSLRRIGIKTDNLVTILWSLNTDTFRPIVSQEVLVISSLAVGEASMRSDLSLGLSQSLWILLVVQYVALASFVVIQSRQVVTLIWIGLCNHIAVFIYFAEVVLFLGSPEEVEI